METRAIRTPFGIVEQMGSETQIRATKARREDWAHRPGACWPCSTLARVPGNLWANFASNGDLVDGNMPENVDGHEFSAWASDVLRAAGLPEHPAIR